MFNNKYTYNIPTKRGWYWVKREGWEVPHIVWVLDRIDGKWEVTMCCRDFTTFDLDYFHYHLTGKGEAMWNGPLKP